MIERFDPLLLSQVRLGIVAVLIARESASFRELKDELAITQGNLGVHLGKLETAGYVAVEKSFVDRKPRTTVMLTDRGRRAMREHVDALARIATTPEG